MLSKNEALQKAHVLRELLRGQDIPVQKFYLFGSAVRETTHRWSDIDIAIVCAPFQKNPLEEYRVIARHAYAVDPRISLLYFRPEHFGNPLSSIVREVKREGIAV